MDPTSFRLAGPSGVPDLSPRPAAPGSAHVVDVTEATFEAYVLVRSDSVPVLLDFWADWCGPCKQLSPVLEKLAVEADGAWVLAKIDVDANPALAQAAAVQGIPAVKAVIRGEVVGEFTGAMPEAQLRPWIAKLLEVAGQLGLATDPSPADSAPTQDPDLARGDEALTAGDLDGATAGYQALLDRVPGHADAVSGLARVRLLRRVTDLDRAALDGMAASDPTGVDTVCAFADVQVVSGDAATALSALVDCVRRTTGAERDRARDRLLDLLAALGDGDPLVLPSRRALANALF